MPGFAPLNAPVTIAAGAMAPVWELKLLSFDEMRVQLKPDTAIGGSTVGLKPDPATAESVARGSTPSNPANLSNPANPTNPANAANPASLDAADGLLINGSVNNGGASPFAQLAAFGNNRRNVRSLYNGGVGVIFGTSALDSRPFSFVG